MGRSDKSSVAESARERQWVSRSGGFEKRDRVVEVVQGYEHAVLLRPATHSLIARVRPRQDLHPPSVVVHPFQGPVEPRSLLVPGAVPRQQNRYARVTIVVPTVFQHTQLQDTVRHPPAPRLRHSHGSNSWTSTP